MTRSVLSFFTNDANASSRAADTAQNLEDHKVIEVYTDGSCIGNGRKNSRGGLAAVFPEHTTFNYSEHLEGTKATNNRAELLAIIRAIQIVDSKIDPSRSRSILIKTDSLLCVKIVTDWMKQWKYRGWKKADKQTPKNLDLLKLLDSLLSRRRVYVKHVTAHTGRGDRDSVYNAMADRLAVQASNSFATNSYR